MSVSEILFVVAGLLVGLSFLNGMFLFLIPFAVVAFVLAWMNRPRLAGPGASTATLPVITLKNRATGTTPVVAPDLRSEFRNGTASAHSPSADMLILCLADEGRGLLIQFVSGRRSQDD